MKLKRLIISLAAITSFTFDAAAQKVEVSNVEALPGEKVSISMRLDTDGGDFSGLEFDILFPRSGFVTTGVAHITAAWDGAFTIGDVGGVGIDNVARCGVLSYSDTPIPSDGMLDFGTVEFLVNDEVPLGDYIVTLTNMTLVGDERVSVPNATFMLSVVDVHTVVLDEDAATPPTAAQGVNVVLNRTLKANQWSTICLPFAVTGEQLKQAYGDDVRMAAFTGWSSREDASGNVVAIDVTFEAQSADGGLSANVPVLICVGQAAKQATFEGVNIEPDDEPSVQVGKKSSERGWFYGTYIKTTVPEENLFITGNKFYYSRGKTIIKAFRGYFEFKDVLDSYYGDNEVKVNCVINGVATNINDVTSHEDGTYIYDLGGRRIEKPVKNGVYVVKGRKAAIKK